MLLLHKQGRGAYEQGLSVGDGGGDHAWSFQDQTVPPVTGRGAGCQARWTVSGGWSASCPVAVGGRDEGAWPSRCQQGKGGTQGEDRQGNQGMGVEGGRRDSSRGRGRGRLGAPPLLLHTHNTHCTLKLSLVSGICSQRGAGGVGVGDWLQVSMEMIGREGPQQVVGAKAGTALTAKLECPDGTRYYFDIQSNM